jgi:hypothetical protein
VIDGEDVLALETDEALKQALMTGDAGHGVDRAFRATPLSTAPVNR